MQPDFFPVEGRFHGTGGFFDEDFVKNKKKKKKNQLAKILEFLLVHTLEAIF